MSGLRNGTSLTDLAIPGSHSSCAAGNLIKLGYLDVTPKLEQKDINAIVEMETRQYDDVPLQLNNGVRMLDVRVGAGLKINQGPFQLPQTLATVLDQAEAFLKTSTREVVVSISHLRGDYRYGKRVSRDTQARTTYFYRTKGDLTILFFYLNKLCFIN